MGFAALSPSYGTESVESVGWAERSEAHHNRSISAIAAWGARTFAPLMK